MNNLPRMSPPPPQHRPNRHDTPNHTLRASALQQEAQDRSDRWEQHRQHREDLARDLANNNQPPDAIAATLNLPLHRVQRILNDDTTDLTDPRAAQTARPPRGNSGDEHTTATPATSSDQPHPDTT